MPRYLYRCELCNREHQAIRSMTDETVEKCNKCGSVMVRLIQCASVIFKGPGFYSTDKGVK